MPLVLHRFLRMLSVAACVLLLSSCAKGSDEEPVSAVAHRDSTVFVSVDYESLPLFFEFNEEGLRQLDSPADAQLRPFEAWPLSYRLAAFSLGSNYAAMAVNRFGFISAVPREDGALSLYRTVPVPQFIEYSIASVFRYQGAPSVLLYRDTFFTDTDTPLLQNRVFSLAQDARSLNSLSLPLFNNHSPSEDWEIDTLEWGSDGNWYFRAFRRNANGGERLYRFSASLDSSPENSDMGSFRAGIQPAAEVPAHLQETFLYMRSWFDDTLVHAAVHSPYYDTLRHFRLVSGSRGPISLSAYTDQQRSVLLLPDGRGLYHAEEPKSFVLPSLPDSYVYTHVVLCGNYMIASWEEQDSWAVGAAGILLLAAP